MNLLYTLKNTLPYFFLISIMPVTLFAQTGVEQHTMKAVDQLNPPSYSSVKIEGRVGKILDSCIQNGVMAVDYGLYSIPFRDKSDEGGMFMGEFWGKWFTSAALACSYQPTSEHLETVERSVEELIATQDPDGRISSYPREENFLNWDIWGRKYALLGLYPENIKWTHADDFGGLDYVLPETVSTGTEDVYIELVPSDSIPANVWMAFEVPCLYRYTHFFNHTRQSILMCDYASAGNEYSTDNLFRVWIPQPLYMHHIFPEETWKILYREGDKRPEFPDLITTLGDENTWERSGEE